jgi:uncharacterized DUF497 family protein
MEFEWDPEKDERNYAKHGIRFVEARMIFDGPVLTSNDNRADYGEERQISIGEIDGIITVVVVHTARGQRTRLISARLANRKERRLYHAFVASKS